MIEQLFSELDRRGLHAEIVGGALKITPSSRIDSDLRQALRENMPAVLAHLTAKGDQGIEWRLARFLEQLKLIHPPATLPLLIALDAGPRRKEDCLSCSELRRFLASDLLCGCEYVTRWRYSDNGFYWHCSEHEQAPDDAVWSRKQPGRVKARVLMFERAGLGL